jgi:acetoin utilization protein AcuB
MLVQNRMSARVISVAATQPLARARQLLDRHRIRQLPVVEGGRLVGIVTDRDLRSAPASATEVADVMSRKLFVIAPTASVDEAARLLRHHRVGALPVVDGGRLRGILSASDILDTYIDVSGVAEATYRIALSDARGKRAEQRVRQIVEHARGTIKWLHPDSRRAGRLHLRLQGRSIDDIVTALEAGGFTVDAVVAPARSRG